MVNLVYRYCGIPDFSCCKKRWNTYFVIYFSFVGEIRSGIYWKISSIYWKISGHLAIYH